MKKTISVVLALAMILMMSLSAFAYSFIVDTPKPEDPEDVEGWTAYYTEITTKIAEISDENQRGDQESEFRGELMNDVMSGAMSISTATQVLQAISGSAGEDSPIAGIIEQIQGVIGNLPSELPSIELPSELPSDFPSDITLPSVGGDDSGNGGFLDTILGALGGIVDGIFGGGGSTGGANGGDDSNTSGGDDEDLWGSEGDDPFNDNSLGDTSVIAVAAVAVVAGAALVLTRKKSKDEDAE